MSPELSIVIVNYNGIKFLKECFDSIYTKLSAINFEIIVVDNDSKDESLKFIKTHYPHVKLIESKVNLGFGKANNVGVQEACGETILLLNNDTILLDDISEAIEILNKDSGIGAIGINMLGENTNYICGVGRFPSPLRLFKMSLLNDQRKEFKTGNFGTKKAFDVDWITGAFFLIKKENYQKVGGFDAAYFMYVEDVDLCKKLSNINKKCVFLPHLRYVHFVGFNKSKNPLLVKGYEIYISKHFSGFEKFLSSISLEFNKFVKNTKKALKID